MKNETTRLLEDRLAVRPDAPETETGGGIIVSSPQAKGRGTVVARGPGKRVPPHNLIQYMAVKIGDTVLYGRFTGGEITVDGESLLLMRECDVVAVVDKAVPVQKTDVPGKATYDACCGADSDCTYDIEDESCNNEDCGLYLTGEERNKPDAETDDEDEAVPGFCARHHSFACGCKDENEKSLCERGECDCIPTNLDVDETDEKRMPKAGRDGGAGC